MPKIKIALEKLALIGKESRNLREPKKTSIKLDFTIQCEEPYLDLYVESLVDKHIYPVEMRSFSGPRMDKKLIELRRITKCIILCLAKLDKYKIADAIGIHLNSRHYLTKNISPDIRRHYPNYENLKLVFDGLKNIGLIKVRAGYYDKRRKGKRGSLSRCSRAFPTKKFREAMDNLLASDWKYTYASTEPVILRIDGQQVEVPDIWCVRVHAGSITKINDMLAKAAIGVDMPWGEFAELQRSISAKRNEERIVGGETPKPAKVVDPTKKSLVKIFSQNPYRGGRLYRGWWQEAYRETRPHITIDGEPTIELDFKTIHPRILYAKAGLELLGDAYVIEGCNIPRSQVKLVLNAMLNTDDKSLLRLEGFDEKLCGCTLGELQKLILAKHAPIAKRFYKGIGTKLQYADAKMAEAILLRLEAKGVVCLSVHDSFIVKRKHEAILRQVMSEVSRECNNGFDFPVSPSTPL